MTDAPIWTAIRWALLVAFVLVLAVCCGALMEAS